MTELWNTLWPPGILSFAFMQNAWIAGTAVAVVAGVVGFFVVLRGASFIAHAVPRGSFAGAAGALLIGQSSLLGLAIFALFSAVGIATLSGRRKYATATALILVAALGLGDLFISIGNVYAPEVFALLFGQLVGVSHQEVLWVLIVSAVTLGLVALAYRPLLLQSVSPEVGRLRGMSARAIEIVFVVLVAAAATATVPVVGALLSFSLMVGPAATGSLLGRTPAAAMGIGISVAVMSLWLAIWLAYVTAWPVGFFVSTICLAAYGTARIYVVRTSRGNVASAQS